MKGPFTFTGGIKPNRSVFDLSYTKYLTCDMGQLIPVLCDEVVPGDKWKIGNDIVIRAQPLVAPMFHEVNVSVHYFFVPNRLLWSDWEDFITGGKDGDYTGSPPLWGGTVYERSKLGTIWDYLGFPIVSDVTGPGASPSGVEPNAFPQRAYNLIWNQYYRDENHMDEVDVETNYKILNRCWKKDYFTSALPWQQRGIAPALPISGFTNAAWQDDDFSNSTTPSVQAGFINMAVSPKMLLNGATAVESAKAFMNSNIVDFGEAATFDVSDLRLAFSMQKFMERSARGGYRYIESLQAHYGVSPRDERLQRPEYIGGTKAPFIVSEVLQTSSTDATSPQGNQAGHGMVVDRNYAGSYFATEHGWIIGLMSIMPKPAYDSQGVNRQHLRRSRYDYYFPEFANLSEQAIIEGEIFATTNASENTAIFGYQGRFDEMRYKPDMTVGQMRDTFDYWHLARKFASAPHLNADFLECKPAETKRIFAVQDEPGLMVTVGNKLTVIRPIPIMSEPGLIDHN